MAVPSLVTHGAWAPAPAGSLWRTRHSSICLSWHYTVCSPSYAFPSHLTGETTVTFSPGCTDKHLEDNHIRTFIWISSQVIRLLMCQRWLFLSQQIVSCLYVAAITMLTTVVLHSLEQRFWAAWACLSVPTALLLFAHPVPRPPGCWHTLNVSEVRTQMQVCTTFWQELLGRQLFTLVPVAVYSPHECQLCQGCTTRLCTGAWTIKLHKKVKWSARRQSIDKHQWNWARYW